MIVNIGLDIGFGDVKIVADVINKVKNSEQLITMIQRVYLKS